MNKALAELVETIGMPAAIYLTRAWGGQALYVPRHPETMHPITLAIGFEASKKLSAAYASTQIMVPAERLVLVELRNTAICDCVQKGESINAVAQRYGVSRKWVHRVLERAGIERPTAIAPERTTSRQTTRKIGGDNSKSRPDRAGR